ncbi:MAG TPA: hypothetical protein VFG05_08810 [Methylocella sp.]|nr:hypothetical protein [Methylocella sp.]
MAERLLPPAQWGAVLYMITPGGDPACASYDGANCLWGLGSGRVDLARVKPLVCGEAHRAVWGTTGYENPKHWCSLARSTQPVQDTLPPNENPECASYARGAVEQYNLMMKWPKCRAGFEKGRWQGNYQAHYGWCMSNPGEAALANERRLRDLHLERCGTQIKFKNPVLIPSE